jgi:hypothetical protein
MVLCLILMVVLSSFFPACAVKPDTGSASPDKLPSKTMDTENAGETANMEAETAADKTARFMDALPGALARRGLTLEKLCDENDPVSRRILREYGAVFLTAESAQPPPVCMFTSEEEVTAFQTKAGAQKENIDGFDIELQPAAMKALQQARAAAQAQGLDITPRDGAEAARRGFADTLRLWNTRFEPACQHWLGRGKLTSEQVANLKSLPIKEQVKQVLELEKSKIYFNTYFNNSILYSVAAPGASQHLSMLAFDANEFLNKRVRRILAEQGWFRTVKNDAPHFTFLGLPEGDLPKLGLKKIDTDQGEYWIPNAKD